MTKISVITALLLTTTLSAPAFATNGAQKEQALVGVDAVEDKEGLFGLKPGGLGDDEAGADVDDGDLGFAGRPAEAEHDAEHDADARQPGHDGPDHGGGARRSLHHDTSARNDALPLA